MKEIPLTQGLIALVDDEEYKTLIKYKWQTILVEGRVRSPSTIFNKKTLQMGRMVLNLTKDNSLVVNYINRNPLDNQRHNLRAINRSQTQHTIKKKEGSTSKYIGVRLEPSGKWTARGQKECKLTYLGSHSTEELAARAYNEWAKANFGEFARLNVIE